MAAPTADDPTSRTFHAGPLRVRVSAGPGAERRERLSSRRIVDEALVQMKQHGYESVSMRSLARALGTGPASLYAHVASRNELDLLVVERVAALLVVPDPDPERWREQLREVMTGMLDLYEQHPGVARASMGIIPVSPSMLRVSDRIAAILRAGGVSDQAVAWFLDLMALYVGSVAVERDVWRARETGGGLAADHDEHAAVHSFFRELPVAEYPVLATLGEALAAGDERARFGFGVDVIIAGVASFVGRG